MNKKRLHWWRTAKTERKSEEKKNIGIPGFLKN
jgi:hypothetical protein